MKILAINGSARADGNTAALLRQALSPLEGAGFETELLQLANLSVEPCRACWACGGRENCARRGDDFGEIFERMKAADALLLGSPTYGANISARMQALLERAVVVCDMNPGLMARKPAAAVSAARRGGALQAVDAMNHFFLNHEMLVVGSTYWNLGYGRAPLEVEADAEARANMENLGRNMVWLLNALRRNEG